jgi:succinate dehydrogenase (ubiquinone) membrane anchor subunit
MPRPEAVVRRIRCQTIWLVILSPPSIPIHLLRSCSRLARYRSYLHCGEMVSVMRSTLLRQSCVSTTRPTRAFSSNPSIAQAFRPKAIRPTSSILSRRIPTVPFHTSSQNAILPPGPQVIDGTANDPAPVPKPSPTHGSYHWTFERAISVGLIPLTIAPFAYGSLNPVLDAAFVATILLHSHIGFT